MNVDLYQSCPVCWGRGEVPALDGSGPPATCHGCYGEKYRPIGLTMADLQRSLQDAHEAHRFYLADGTALHVDRADEVRTLRIAAARKIAELEAIVAADSTKNPEKGP